MSLLALIKNGSVVKSVGPRSPEENYNTSATMLQDKKKLHLIYLLIIMRNIQFKSSL
jgi:hypothetical protein